MCVLPLSLSTPAAPFFFIEIVLEIFRKRKGKKHKFLSHSGLDIICSKNKFFGYVHKFWAVRLWLVTITEKKNSIMNNLHQCEFLKVDLFILLLCASEYKFQEFYSFCWASNKSKCSRRTSFIHKLCLDSSLLSFFFLFQWNTRIDGNQKLVRILCKKFSFSFCK